MIFVMKGREKESNLGCTFWFLSREILDNQLDVQISSKISVKRSFHYAFNSNWSFCDSLFHFQVLKSLNNQVLKSKVPQKPLRKETRRFQSTLGSSLYTALDENLILFWRVGSRIVGVKSYFIKKRIHNWKYK